MEVPIACRHVEGRGCYYSLCLCEQEDTEAMADIPHMTRGQQIWADAIKRVGFYKFPEPAIIELGKEIIAAIDDDDYAAAPVQRRDSG